MKISFVNSKSRKSQVNMYSFRNFYLNKIFCQVIKSTNKIINTIISHIITRHILKRFKKACNTETTQLKKNFSLN